MTDFSQIAKEAELKKNAPSSVSVSKNFNYVKANYVSIVDIDTPFKSMVFYYFKWSFAVIPTGIFWGVIYIILMKIGLEKLL